MTVRAWPSRVNRMRVDLTISAHSRGGRGLGGHAKFETGPGAAWRGQVVVPALCTADAVAFRAFLHSLRGRYGAFSLRMFDRDVMAPANPVAFTDGTYFTDDTRFVDFGHEYVAGTVPAGAAVGASSFVVSSDVAASALVRVGAFAWVGSTETGQLLRVVSVSGTTIGFRPALRSALAAGGVVTFGAVTARFRLDQDVPAVPLIAGRSREFDISIAEQY